MTTFPYSLAAHSPVAQGIATTIVGAGASHAIQRLELKDVQCTTDSGANLTLKYDVSDVRFPIVFAFRVVAAGCVVHFEKGHGFTEFPHGGRETRGDTFWLPARYAEKNTDRKPDVVRTVDGEPKPAGDRDERPVPIRSHRGLMHWCMSSRDWCPPCIAGKAPNWPHRRVVVDYNFMNKTGDSDVITLLNWVDC